MVYHARTKIGVDVLRFNGDLDALSMIKMKGRMNRLLNRNHKRLLLDLKDTKHVELAGVGILVDRLRKVREQKGTSNCATCVPSGEDFPNDRRKWPDGKLFDGRRGDP